MIDFFNEIIKCFSLFVDLMFSEYLMFDTVPIGWLLLALAVMGIVIRFLYGRFS